MVNKDHVVCILLALVVIYPILNPIGLPILIHEDSLRFYDEIEALPPDSLVLVGFDGTYMGLPRILPLSLAIGNELFEKPIKIVFISTCAWGAEAPTLLETMIFPELDMQDKVYGVDYVNLGFYPGQEPTIAALAADVHSVVGTDFHGTSIDKLPIMEYFKSAKDITLFVGIGSAGIIDVYVRQFNLPYGTPEIFMVTAMGQLKARPYLEAGQVRAILVDVLGIAEYELLIGRPGEAIASSDVVSTTHILLVFIVIITNISYYVNKYMSKTSKKGDE